MAGGIGTVFYHRQSTEDLVQGGECYLAYGLINTTKYGEVGLPTAEVGRIAVLTLRECGLEVEWDGDEAKRILVRFPSTPESVYGLERFVQEEGMSCVA